MAVAFRLIAKLTGLIILILICIQLHIHFNEPWYKHKLKRLQLMTILQTALSYGSLYLYKTYSASPVWKKLTLCVIGLTHFSFFAQYIFVYENPSMLTTVPFLGFSLHLFMILGTLLGDIGTFFCVPFTVLITVQYQKMKLNIVPICAVVLTLWSYLNTILPPQHSTIHVPISGLHPSFDQLHIVQLSDIHVGPTTGKSYIDWLVDEVNSLNPDLVVISGDLVDSSVKNLKTAVWNLKNLKSKYGTFYCTGNHEYYTSDVDNWLNYLHGPLGMHTLHNSHSVITTPGTNASVCIAGVDDPQAEKMDYVGHMTDPVGAVSGCPTDAPIIMLAHQPKAAQQTLRLVPEVDLILSGHTHGGQFFPCHIVAYLTNPFFAGLYNPAPDTHVFVSRGLRFYGAPMRLLSYPEYTSVILHPKIPSE